MDAIVEIDTYEGPTGIEGHVKVNGKLILTIHNGKIDNHVGADPIFSEDTIREIDRRIKEWVRDVYSKRNQ